MTVKTEMLNEEVGRLRRAVSTFKGALRKAESERDSLRKVAQMALEWFDWLNATTGPISPPHVAKDVQNALRKELSE